MNVGVDVDVEHVELETDYPYYFKNGIIPSQYRRDEIQFSPFSSMVDRIQSYDQCDGISINLVAFSVMHIRVLTTKP